MVTLQRQLDIPPGHRVILRDVSWPEFESILAELGEHRAARLAYSKGTLEIRMPLPEHEVDKGIIGDMVKILLEELEINRGAGEHCLQQRRFKQTRLPLTVNVQLQIVENFKHPLFCCRCLGLN